MKKIICFFILLNTVHPSFSQDAGLPPRAYTKIEMARWSQVCEWLGIALPKTFTDFKMASTDCDAFDWAEKDRNGNPLTIMNKKKEAIGNLPYHNVSLRMDDDTADARNKAIDAQMLDANGNFDQSRVNMVSVKEAKFNVSHNPEITIQTNVKVDIAKQYERSAKPIKLDIGIDAFAYLYIFPEGKEVKEEGSVIGTDGLEFYKDKALIIISAKAPKVVTQPVCNCTWKEDKIFPQDTAPDTLMAPIKNIVVQIYGYEADVRALIKQIDWRALQALIGK